MQKEKSKNKGTLSTEKLLSISDEFDQYDIVEHLDESEEVEFDVQLIRRHFCLEQSLAEKISKISSKRGVSTETYVNLILQQKVLEEVD
ncbi:hypothetical protein H8E88_24000 [candidate division KSB1 bacterium]|nr:hypothetical protein [candidate division KSB1 bacterium]MBL7093380.1 hypothetical protein [candidate division KSB1 bacterium]